MGSLSKSRLLRLSAALAAGLALQPAMAQVSVSNTGTGSTAVIPYYTVNDGWRSLIHITNTTGDSLIVKVRFHESRNSRDVLDFNIGLSPRDVWTGFLAEESVNGLPTMVLRTQDTSCVSPIDLHPTFGSGSLPASVIGYSDFGPGSNQTFRDHDATNAGPTGSIEAGRRRAFEGYVVIMTMGWFPGGGDNTGANAIQNSSLIPLTDPVTLNAAGSPTANNDNGGLGTAAAKAKHVTKANGTYEPRDCPGWNKDNLAYAYPTPEGLFVNQVSDVQGTAENIPGNRGSGGPCTRLGTVDARCTGSTDGSRTGYLALTADQGNTLKVQATLRKGDSGYAAHIEPLHIQGWGIGAAPADITAPELDAAFVNRGLVTAQVFPSFFEPTLASLCGLWTTNGLVDGNCDGVNGDGLENLIASTTIANDWVNNPTGDPNARGEWVLTFPTKYFHVDEDFDNVQAGCSRYRNTLVTAATGGQDSGTAAGGGNNVTDAGSRFGGFSPAVHSQGPRSVVPFGTPGSGINTAAAGVDDITTCGLFPFFETFQAAGNGQSSITYQLQVYDREERTATISTGLPVQSPNPPQATSPASLLYEANVLRIGRNPDTIASVLSSPLTALGNANNLAGTANNGWARVSFNNPLPVTGFLMRVRQFAGSAPDQNDADAIPHARNVP
jgi:hypothetical protein